MSGRSSVYAATLERFSDGVEEIDGVDVLHLPPFTTLLVRTTNSLYRVVVLDGAKVYLQGGALFPDPTSACLDGASIGGSCLKVGWIGIGMRLEIRAGDRRITTTPVRAIALQASTGPGTDTTPELHGASEGIASC